MNIAVKLQARYRKDLQSMVSNTNDVTENAPKTAALPSELEQKKNRPGNEAGKIRFSTRLIEVGVLLLSGMLMTASLPPLNWSFTSWIAIIPLYWIAHDRKPFRAWRAGWVWGLAWGFTSFYWLREINPAIPYMIGPVIALYTGCWSAAVPLFRRGILIPAEIQLAGCQAEQNYRRVSVPRELFLAAALAGWWCVLESGRSTMLPWNYTGSCQWQNLPLIQICEYTGVYGISFLLVMLNITIVMAIQNCLKSRNAMEKMPQPVPLMITVAVMLSIIIFGASLILTAKQPAQVNFSAALIQGDISQRRNADNSQALEALDIYMQLSELIAPEKPDIIIWPETAVPYPYRGNNNLCREYRSRLTDFIKRTQIPMLIGTLDFEQSFDRNQPPLMLNSAFLFDNAGRSTDKFDKVQRVPFGEFIPFRKYLPEFITRLIDMNRDLTPGKSFSPLKILPGVNAGINICFEDTFPYVGANEARRGANLLLVITNDAWYPASCEPEQHLANSVFRSIETRLPMLRCGNNSASCLIMPSGLIADAVMKKTDPQTGKQIPDVLQRGRAAGVVKVPVPVNPQPTFYTLYGDVFLYCCMLLTMAASLVSMWSWRRKKDKFNAMFDPK
ncbi:MAG: apolipoprotein N-acyltransferase [Victivallaceae bacterium]|jgi:apolipoprotein N-acyltransferase